MRKRKTQYRPFCRGSRIRTHAFSCHHLVLETSAFDHSTIPQYKTYLLCRLSYPPLVIGTRFELVHSKFVLTEPLCAAVRVSTSFQLYVTKYSVCAGNRNRTDISSLEGSYNKPLYYSRKCPVEWFVSIRRARNFITSPFSTFHGLPCTTREKIFVLLCFLFLLSAFKRGARQGKYGAVYAGIEPATQWFRGTRSAIELIDQIGGISPPKFYLRSLSFFNTLSFCSLPRIAIAVIWLSRSGSRKIDKSFPSSL